MTQGVIWKQLLGFSVPLAIGLLFQQLYNTVDAVVVGHYVGTQALAAVGSTSNIINILVGLCSGLSAGAGVIISQCYGTHDEQRLHNAVHTTILVTFILSAIVTVLGMLIVKPMLKFMATPDDVMQEATEYLKIYFGGVSGLLVYNMGSGILRAVGDSRRPLYFLIFSALVNIVFDLVFVIVFDMGVAGVAYATILAQFLSAILVLVVLSRSKESYGLRWRDLRINKIMLRSIMSVGMPSGLQQALISFSNVFVQSYINYFGSACMAGWSAYNKLDVFVIIPLESLSMASMTFVGQNYGAGNLDRGREGVKKAMGMSMVVTIALCAGLMATKRYMLMLFSTDEAVIDYGVRFMNITLPFYFTLCFTQIYGGALRGIGRASVCMVTMLATMVGFRQLFLFVTKLLSCGFFAVALAYPMGWVTCSIVLIVVYRRSELCSGKRREKKLKSAI